MPLLELTPAGIYCKAGDFYVDPWKPVGKAVITHGHADHARPGSERYLACDQSAPILRTRLGAGVQLDTQPYGSEVQLHGVKLSFHPAGHILGSAQVRVEHRGEIAVVSGDYKCTPDPTCAAWEPIRCHTFVTESTFGLPIYRWPDADDVFAEIHRWWAGNQREGKASLLLGYALGKAQRLLAGLNPEQGKIFTHGAVESLNTIYREAGVDLPPTTYVGDAPDGTDWSQAMIVAPPSASGSTWPRRFGPISFGMASGWMQIRGTRRRRSVDRGFVLSDHCDWTGLIGAIAATGAESVWVTHGYADIVARHLREAGIDAQALSTEFVGEDLDDSSDSALLAARGGSA